MAVTVFVHSVFWSVLGEKRVDDRGVCHNGLMCEHRKKKKKKKKNGTTRRREVYKRTRMRIIPRYSNDSFPFFFLQDLLRS